MDYSPIFDAAGKQFNVDPALLAAQMHVESNGNPNAVSPVGAQGLMQIMPSTAKSLGVDATDPQQAIYGAAKLMAQNLDRYGNVADAVRAYHGGTDKANWGPKTQAYLNKVMAGYQGTPMPGSAQAQTAPDPLDAYLSGKPIAGAAPAVAQGQQAAGPDPLDAYLSGAPVAGAEPAVAQGQQPAPVAPAAPGQLPQGAQTFLGKVGDAAAGYLDRMGGGAAEGIARAADTPAEWLAKGLDATGLTTGGYDAQVAADKARREAYDASPQSQGFVANSARLGGEMAGPMAEMGLAGRALTAGGNALLTGLRGAGTVGEALSAPLAGVGKFVSGNGGFLSRVANSAAQGATGAALLSGGGNETPIGTQMGLGALLGGALPVAGGIVKGVGAAGSATAKGINTLMGRGQDSAVNDIVSASAQRGAPGLADLKPGATLDEISQAAPTNAINDLLAGKAQGAPGLADLKPGATLDEISQAAPTNAINDLLAGKAQGAPIGADFRELVPGSKPTLAQATGNSGIAEMERAAISQNSAPFTAQAAANNAARSELMQKVQGTPETRAELEAAREAVTEPLREAALSNPIGPANAQPVVDVIDGMLAGPEGKQSAVRNALKTAKAGLFDADGNLETDPNMLYGVRKEINNLIEPLAGSPTSDTKLAARQLGVVKDALDNVIEPVAPGFGQYLSTYADMSRPIEAQRFLQGRDLKNADSTTFSLPKVKSLMLTIQKMQSAPGANPAKSLTPEQMGDLQALHMDLQREANSKLGTGGNSATAQLLNGNNRLNQMLGGTVARVTAPSVGATVGGLMGGPLGAAAGSTLGHLAGNALERTAAQRSSEINDRLIQILLGHGGADSLKMLVPNAQQGANSLVNGLGGAAGTAGAAQR